jgi:hypothetical protein
MKYKNLIYNPLKGVFIGILIGIFVGICMGVLIGAFIGIVGISVGEVVGGATGIFVGVAVEVGLDIDTGVFIWFVPCPIVGCTCSVVWLVREVCKPSIIFLLASVLRCLSLILSIFMAILLLEGELFLTFSINDFIDSFSSFFCVSA